MRSHRVSSSLATITAMVVRKSFKNFRVLRIRNLAAARPTRPLPSWQAKKDPDLLGPGPIPHLGACLHATICLTVQRWIVIFWSSSNHSEYKKRRVGGEQPWLKLLCLNPLRLEPGDSRLQTRVPELGGEGTLDTAGILRPVTIHRTCGRVRLLFSRPRFAEDSLLRKHY